jgi:hypothetical protein
MSGEMGNLVVKVDVKENMEEGPMMANTELLKAWISSGKATFTHVARLEAIRILLAFAASKGFKLYQMDMKSDFLDGVIQEEVFVRQPPRF